MVELAMVELTMVELALDAPQIDTICKVVIHIQNIILCVGNM